MVTVLQVVTAAVAELVADTVVADTVAAAAADTVVVAAVVAAAAAAGPVMVAAAAVTATSMLLHIVPGERLALSHCVFVTPPSSTLSPSFVLL